VFGAAVVGCGGTERTLGPVAEPQANVADMPGPHGKLVFHSTRDGNFDVYAMNADGSNQTRLTSDENNDIDPVWSPNGQMVAFNRFPADFSGCQVYIMNADGTGIRQLTTPGSQYQFGGIWSPNGKQIAFTSSRDGADDIYVINVDGTGLRRVTTNAYVGGVGAWSPDGKLISFVGYKDFVDQYPYGGDQEIYTVNLSDGTITQLTDNDVDDEGDRAGWSPDGKLFTFSSRRDGWDLDIFVMNADGTNVRQVTGIGGDYVDDDDSYWSPDGKYLSFQSSRDGNEEVYTARVDGSDVRRLTFQPGGFDAVATWTGGNVQPVAGSR
jgi:TolB protein